MVTKQLSIHFVNIYCLQTFRHHVYKSNRDLLWCVFITYYIIIAITIKCNGTKKVFSLQCEPAGYIIVISLLPAVNKVYVQLPTDKILKAIRIILGIIEPPLGLHGMFLLHYSHFSSMFLTPCNHGL